MNVAGHSQTGYFAPPEFGQMSFDVEGEYKSARALKAGTELKVERGGGRTRIVLPGLGEYELIVLE